MQRWQFVSVISCCIHQSRVAACVSAVAGYHAAYISRGQQHVCHRWQDIVLYTSAEGSSMCVSGGRISCCIHQSRAAACVSAVAGYRAVYISRGQLLFAFKLAVSCSPLHTRLVPVVMKSSLPLIKILPLYSFYTHHMHVVIQLQPITVKYLYCYLSSLKYRAIILAIN